MLLQNPFEFAASDAVADTAVASLPHAPAPDAAATFFDSGATACAPDEAVASFRQTSDAAVDIPVSPGVYDGSLPSGESEPSVMLAYAPGENHICEIFAGARKLFDPDPAAYTNADHVYYDLLKQWDNPHTADLIEMPYGMEGIFDPAPLFLRQVG